MIDLVMGVVKAYTTRVGEGRFRRSSMISSGRDPDQGGGTERRPGDREGSAGLMPSW
jgi:adenylosuccinate synthase